MTRLKRSRIGGVLLCLLLTVGCGAELAILGVGAMAGVGTYKWMEGTMEKDYPRPMEACWHACLAATKTMGLRITGERYNPLESQIEAVQPDGTSVNINLVGRPNQITTVKVRFGWLGNKDASGYFHRLVLKNLGLPPE